MKNEEFSRVVPQSGFFEAIGEKKNVAKKMNDCIVSVFSLESRDEARNPRRTNSPSYQFHLIQLFFLSLSTLIYGEISKFDSLRNAK